MAEVADRRSHVDRSEPVEIEALMDFVCVRAPRQTQEAVSVFLRCLEGHLLQTAGVEVMVLPVATLKDCPQPVLSATEVEDLLRAHPSVVDAVVVGVPDEEWGEVVAAWVVPVAGEFDVDDVGAWLEEQASAPKRPRRWVVESQVPLNANGKPDRVLVRELLGA